MSLPDRLWLVFRIVSRCICFVNFYIAISSWTTERDECPASNLRVVLVADTVYRFMAIDAKDAITTTVMGVTLALWSVVELCAFPCDAMKHSALVIYVTIQVVCSTAVAVMFLIYKFAACCIRRREDGALYVPDETVIEGAVDM